MNCRGCSNKLQHEFVDLGEAPASNSFLTREQLGLKENRFPLKLFVCESCFLVQVDEHMKSSEIFGQEYVYFSSYSRSWLDHVKNYVGMVSERFSLNKNSLVIELASNDGYLLQYFKDKHIPVMGIEPSKSVATAAQEKGIETVVEFFGVNLAKKLISQGKSADLLIGNNVLAHVPDINDFVGGMKIILKENGVITAEFPHLMKLIEKNLFDTIYQEHFSYFSFHTINNIFVKQGLKLFDVDILPTQGGSLRIYGCHVDDHTKKVSENVTKLLKIEKSAGMLTLPYYKGYDQKVQGVRDSLMTYLKNEKVAGKKIIGYGAAAKGNTFLNYCDIHEDVIDFVVDISKHKQGKFLPGSHIPVVSEDKIRELKPDFVLILPWNLREEITTQLAYIRQWGGKFIIAIPSLEVF